VAFVLGQRPGEMVRCIHSDEMEAGCGTAEACAVCGAVNAIVECQRTGRKVAYETRITARLGGELQPLDLRVTATPLRVRGEDYVLVSMTDVSDEKRRLTLERIFFHDILNTAGGMMGLAELLRDGTPEDFAEYKEIIYMLSHTLVDEIKAQQILAAAEAGELSLDLTRFNSLHLVYELLGAYAQHEVAQGRNLAVAADAEAVSFVSDKTLVRRVVGNMVKNALEASHPGQTVTIRCRGVDDAVEFSVHNPNEMPRSVQLQIFQRSFSTKGAGRGLGTYSMKLLSERYLCGSVSFTSSPQEGTVFRARYPLCLEAPEALV
jgi:signal transduction histidine kinase